MNLAWLGSGQGIIFRSMIGPRPLPRPKMTSHLNWSSLISQIFTLASTRFNSTARGEFAISPRTGVQALPFIPRDRFAESLAEAGSGGDGQPPPAPAGRCARARVAH